MPPTITRVSASTLARQVKVAQPAARSAAIAVAGPDRAGVTYRELARRIRNTLLEGRLAANTQLPSERNLAEVLNLSRTTVAAAYALLRDEGWLVSRRGSGSVLQHSPSASPDAFSPFWGHSQSRDNTVINLTTASLPAPAEQITAAVAAAAAQLPSYFGADGYVPMGLAPLRDMIARRYTESGLPTTPDEILVTSGAQHAWSLIVSELSLPGDRVLLDCPTYPLALDAVRSGRRTPVPVGIRPGAERPWDLELMTAAMVQSAPRLAYLIPDFHNPTGSLMDAATRRDLVAAAARTATVLVTDESLRDVAFDPDLSLPPRLAAFDSVSRVITIGSMSKSFWGGLRVGWIRANRGLVERLAGVRALGDMAGPILDQLVALEVLADPEPSLDLQRGRLHAGCAALLEALAHELPLWRPTRPSGGASLWVELPGPYATELARLAPSAGVAIVPGPRFGPDGTMESYLRLPFTAPPDALRVAVQRLASVDAAAAAARPALPLRWMT